MSASGISSSNFFQLNDLQNPFQQRQNEFKQLGQDLQAGNLSQAQQDFATLTQNAPGGAQNSGGALSQDLNALGSALQSGNISGAQQAFSTLQQDIQQQVGQSGGGHHRHRHIQDSDSSSSSQSNPLAQAFSALGQALQSGNLSDAQNAYSTIQQDLQQLGVQAGAGSSTSSQLSVSA